MSDTQTPEQLAAADLYNEVFEQIEAGAIDDACEETFPGGSDAYDDAEGSVADAHYESVLRKVCHHLASMLTARSNGDGPDDAEHLNHGKGK